MGYKQIDKNLSFADLAVSKSLEKNRSLKMMEKINKVKAIYVYPLIKNFRERLNTQYSSPSIELPILEASRC